LALVIDDWRLSQSLPEAVEPAVAAVGPVIDIQERFPAQVAMVRLLFYIRSEAVYGKRGIISDYQLVTVQSELIFTQNPRGAAGNQAGYHDHYCQDAYFNTHRLQI